MVVPFTWPSPNALQVNNTPNELQYKQFGDKAADGVLASQVIKAGSSVVFHWPSQTAMRLLQVRVLRPGDNSMWSTAFKLDGRTSDEGQHSIVKVRRPASKNIEHLEVSIQQVAPVAFAVFAPGKRESAPLMLSNQLREEVRFHQKGCNYPDSLKPGQVRQQQPCLAYSCSLPQATERDVHRGFDHRSLWL